ncbi:MAG: ImmA/IrrE family metallo-endopeptidase, partial [Bacillota bacterium]
HGINPAIYLDRELKHNPKLYRLARCILAEELGHYFTGITSSVFKIHANYSLERKMSVAEKRALHWATSRLIPTDEILELLSRNKWECMDLADYFEVTTWFMFRKLEFVQYQIKARRREISFDLITQVKFSCL